MPFQKVSLKRARPFFAALLFLVLALCTVICVRLVSTQNTLVIVGQMEAGSEAMFAEMSRHYRLELVLDLVLVVIAAAIGVTLFLLYRHLVQVSAAIKEIQTIDHKVLNSITRGIITVDLHGEITSCNRAMEDILGIPAADLVGHVLSEPFSEEDPLCLMLQESIQEQSRPQDVDIEYSTRDARTIPLRVTTFSLRNEDGTRVGAILLIKDMTELHKMAERVQRASRMEALGQLTQRLVHEIRNPLSAMDINLQLLQERLDVVGEESEIGRYLDIISNETRRLNEVLRDAQFFSRPQAPALEQVDLHQIIRQVLFFLQEEAIRKNVEITDSLRAETSLVMAEADQIKQVFLNLCKNSIEAMVEGGKLEIISKNGGNGTFIGLELVDSGKGIPLSNLQSIFDPYYTTKKKGTGLGLSIVHNIIVQHGGSIDVSSWLGEGTIFSIILPLAPGSKEESGDQKAENSHR
jgi:PAS domain S-box-containing protein